MPQEKPWLLFRDTSSLHRFSRMARTRQSKGKAYNKAYNEAFITGLWWKISCNNREMFQVLIAFGISRWIFTPHPQWQKPEHFSTKSSNEWIHLIIVIHQYLHSKHCKQTRSKLTTANSRNYSHQTQPPEKKAPHFKWRTYAKNDYANLMYHDLIRKN